MTKARKVAPQLSSSVGAYMNEIGRTPLLTPDQEIDLARKVQRMHALNALERPLTKAEQREVRIGKRAADKFVEANLRLVVSIAKKYVRMTNSLDLMDLVQEGNLGLINGVMKFDPERGYKFSTYSYWWVRQAMTRAIRYKDRTLRLPGNIAEMAYTWGTKRQRLRIELGREPSLTEMAEVFKVSPEDVSLYIERGHHLTSLDQLIGEGADTAIVELVADPRDAEGEEAIELALIGEMAGAVAEALVHLSPLQRETVELRFGLSGQPPMTLQQIGTVQGVTREAARLRLVKACNRLKMVLRATYKSRENLVASLAA
jgi:RNA polymerase sigma factor (sigma-70 family)